MRPYRTFVIHEPKQRRICAAHFRDRVVQHAVCGVIGPIVESSLIQDTYACRAYKGSHAAVRRVQQLSRRCAYVLACDVRRYFETIDQGMLKTLLRRKLKDRALLSLLDRIVEHPIPNAVPGKGVPIGNLTSQYFANLYLGELDHFVKDYLGVPGYVRYMDDVVMFDDDRCRLRETLDSVREFLGGRLRQELREERTRIAPVSEGVPYLGFRVFPGVIRIDGRRWARLRRRVRRRETAFRRGLLGEDALARTVRSMVAHVGHVDSLQARRLAFATLARLG